MTPRRLATGLLLAAAFGFVQRHQVAFLLELQLVDVLLQVLEVLVRLHPGKMARAQQMAADPQLAASVEQRTAAAAAKGIDAAGVTHVTLAPGQSHTMRALIRVA